MVDYRHRTTTIHMIAIVDMIMIVIYIRQSITSRVKDVSNGRMIGRHGNFIEKTYRTTRQKVK